MVATKVATRTVGLLYSRTRVMTARAMPVIIQMVKRKKSVTTANRSFGAAGGPTSSSVPRNLKAQQDHSQAMRVFVRVATSEAVHTQKVIV